MGAALWQRCLPGPRPGKDHAMTTLEPITLKGERALLEPLALEHADALFAVSRDPQIWEYLPVRADTATQMRGWIEDALTARHGAREMPFAIIDRQSGRPVGSTRLIDFDPPNRNVEIGWT